MVMPANTVSLSVVMPADTVSLTDGACAGCVRLRGGVCCSASSRLHAASCHADTGKTATKQPAAGYGNVFPNTHFISIMMEIERILIPDMDGRPPPKLFKGGVAIRLLDKNPTSHWRRH